MFEEQVAMTDGTVKRVVGGSQQELDDAVSDLEGKLAVVMTEEAPVPKAPNKAVRTKKK